ncbi:MAG: hypothetical protein KDJ34_19980 [Candidatus Competibacteraceae bacterium]|nr:hypothetical protein [Candidatus Competibacteraceae bacterium]MCP5135091.1 hypothetical protein [Gammaproteobacteria bacterium]
MKKQNVINTRHKAVIALLCGWVITAPAAWADSLENPQPGSFQSGVGIISGWVCNASHVYFMVDNSQTANSAAYGTERPDTLSVCGKTNTGFGLLVNYNSLGAGQHTIRAFADGVEFGKATFTVNTFGQDFLRGASGSFKISGFPQAGTDVTLVWQESQQNFAIAKVEASNGSGGGGSGGGIGVKCSDENFTVAKFNAITTSPGSTPPFDQGGMTVDQVTQIIGCDYDPSKTVDNGNTILYTWIYSGQIPSKMILVSFFHSTSLSFSKLRYGF